MWAEVGIITEVHVWGRVTQDQALEDSEGQLVGTQWGSMKKGDKVRCRLVAQEFAGIDMRAECYVGTPSLPATRYLHSDGVVGG